MRVRLSVRHTLYRWLARKAVGGLIGPYINECVRVGVDLATIPPCRRHVAFGCKFSFVLEDEIHELLTLWASENEMNATDVIRGLLHQAWEQEG